MRPIEMKKLLGPTSNLEFQKDWYDVCEREQREQDEWILKLIEDGIKAAHPDDGWNDRDNNEIHFAYPRFIHPLLQIGNLVALGRPEKFHIVKLTSKKIGFGDMIYWKYEKNFF